MKLLLKRIAKKDKYTIGNLYVDGKFFCNTLEDKDRGLNSQMSLKEIKNKKVYGETAIPIGTYKIDMDEESPSFKNRTWAKPYNGKIPRLSDVPGYSGVLIHPGNDQSDTLGCILVGRNTQVGKVLDSQNTFHSLMKMLAKGDNIITIE